MSFYFTIIDDTDDATVENTKPIYDLLYENKIFCTKTIWVYPPRDKNSKGDSIQRKKYLEFIKDIKSKGYETGLHNVGSGEFEREEILKGLNIYKELLGEYPKIHVNHSYNKDSIYGGFKRFNFPVNLLIKYFYQQYSNVFQGDTPGSKYFWGDKHKEYILYSRNHECGELNTIKFDPYMPYIDPKRKDYANYWYSATFAPNPWIFNKMVNQKSIEKLAREKGKCIIFTHLGYFMQNGEINHEFEKTIEILAARKDGVYLPLGKMMETIVESRKRENKALYPQIPGIKKLEMELRHLFTRFKFRKILQMDDYAYKNLKVKMFKS